MTRVLVLEDSDSDFCLIEHALAGHFDVFRTTTLAAAIETAATTAWDLVILDLSLEDSYGYETFEKARAAFGGPILILSGSEDDELALRAVKNGAEEFIRKSLLINYPLDRAVRYAIERQRAQKAAERRLRASEQFATATVNSLAAHIAILDDSGTIVAVNTAWNDFAEENGVPNHAAVGANYLTVCERVTGQDAGDAQWASAGIGQVLRRERPVFEFEYACHSPTEERWFLMRATPFGGDGPTRVVISHENITSRKIAERLASEQCGLRDAVAGMEQVLGVVGHELRTPLAALRAISEFLITDGARDTVDANRFLLAISQEVDRMSDTVNNLLEAARLNSGRARWNWSLIDLAGVIEEATLSIRPLLDPEKVQIVTDTDGSLGHMLGDVDAIRRLLINLLSNARKHTGEGRIEVHARQELDGNGSWVELVVRDTGGGIAPEVLARLGEAFALNSGVVGRNHISGTGLGLPICKGIARAHGGELRVESEEGRGTTVIARLRADLEAATSGDTVAAESPEEAMI